MGEGGGFPGIVVFPNFNMPQCLSSGEKFLKVKRMKRVFHHFTTFIATHPEVPQQKKKTLLGLSNGKLCVPNEMYSDLSVNTFLIYISH